MIKEVFSTLRWSVSLGAKFFRVVPFYTFIIVMLTLVAQLSTVLSSFLPLKVIILLGSEGMPRYFPSSFQAIGRDTLIVLLSVATVCFFLLTLLANKLIDLATARASEMLLTKSHKLTLFENQDQVAANGYQKYSSALSGLVFVGLTLLGVGYFYPSMSLAVIGYCVSVFILVLGFAHFISGFKEYLEIKISFFVSLVTNLGFFFVFAYLVLEFVLWTPPGFIVVIVSLLLSRQIFSRVNGFVVGVYGLSKQKQKLDVLFFHGKQLIPSASTSNHKSIWGLLHPEVRNAWLLRLLAEIDRPIARTDAIKATWMDSSQPDIPHLQVSSESTDRVFLVKLYEKNRTALAKHEASLLLDPPKGLPAPRLLLVTELEKLACHVYELQSGMLLTKKDTRHAVKPLRYHLALLSPPVGLKNRYLRSKPMVAERLTANFLERIKVAAKDQHHLMIVDQFLTTIPELKSRLDKLPLALVNPELPRSLWSEQEISSPLSMNWEKWSLEPLGCGVPPNQIDEFLVYIASENSEKKYYVKLDPDSVRLAASALELERLINKQQLALAFKQVKSMLRLLNNI